MGRPPAPAGRRARARARDSWWTSRWPTARSRGSRWWPPATSPTGRFRAAGDLPLAGSLICYRPYECADGWVTLGALEPKFWQAFCRGVGREELIGKQFEHPGSEAHAQVTEIFKGRSRAQWEAFAREHDCCLEPVLELDEALASELVREREMVVEIEQPGAERAVRQLGLPVKLSRTPGEHARLPGPALGEHTEAVLTEPATPGRRWPRCARPERWRDRRPRSRAATFRA